MQRAIPAWAASLCCAWRRAFPWLLRTPASSALSCRERRQSILARAWEWSQSPSPRPTGSRWHLRAHLALNGVRHFYLSPSLHPAYTLLEGVCLLSIVTRPTRPLAGRGFLVDAALTFAVGVGCLFISEGPRQHTSDTLADVARGMVRSYRRFLTAFPRSAALVLTAVAEVCAGIGQACACVPRRHVVLMCVCACVCAYACACACAYACACACACACADGRDALPAISSVSTVDELKRPRLRLCRRQAISTSSGSRMIAVCLRTLQRTTCRRSRSPPPSWDSWPLESSRTSCATVSAAPPKHTLSTP